MDIFEEKLQYLLKQNKLNYSASILLIIEFSFFYKKTNIIS